MPTAVPIFVSHSGAHHALALALRPMMREAGFDPFLYDPRLWRPPAQVERWKSGSLWVDFETVGREVNIAHLRGPIESAACVLLLDDANRVQDIESWHVQAEATYARWLSHWYSAGPPLVALPPAQARALVLDGDVDQVRQMLPALWRRARPWLPYPRLRIALLVAMGAALAATALLPRGPHGLVCEAALMAGAASLLLAEGVRAWFTSFLRSGFLGEVNSSSWIATLLFGHRTRQMPGGEPRSREDSGDSGYLDRARAGTPACRAERSRIHPTAGAARLDAGRDLGRAGERRLEAVAVIHACSPARWRGEPRAGGPHHALVCTGTIAAFAAGQLHAGVLTAFQSILRGHPDIGEAIEAEGRLPSWEAVGTLHSSAGSGLQELLQCRRLADLLSQDDDRGCRAILTFVGWQRLGTDSQWRKATPNDPDPPPHPGGGELLTGWVQGLLEPDAPAAEDDSPQHLHELAACAFRPLALPGSLAARLAEQRLARDGAPDTPQLADALAGDLVARDAIRRLVSGTLVGDRLLSALLVAALNPPLCITLLGADDTMPDWDCLQPGRRFRRLCAARDQLAGLDDNASVPDVEAWIDAACGHLGWPLHGAILQRAQQARVK